jgi:hypothetical protein
MLACNYCGKKWKNMQSLRMHLRWCLERKKARNKWVRFPISDGARSATLCVISRSPKTIKALTEQHRLLVGGSITPSFFLGLAEGYRLQGLIEVKLEGS